MMSNIDYSDAVSEPHIIGYFGHFLDVLGPFFGPDENL